MYFWGVRHRALCNSDSMCRADVRFLELEDITEGMSEPCVMDVKIGRRTWDPLATPEKRAAEEIKYAESKRAYGFCVPGFQVYRLPQGDLRRYGNDYGKKLNAETLVQGEHFLSVDCSNLLSFLRIIMDCGVFDDW